MFINMYTSLLANQQLKKITGLWQKQFLLLLPSRLRNCASHNAGSAKKIRIYTPKHCKRKIAVGGALLNQRLHSTCSLQLSKHEKSLELSDVEYTTSINDKLEEELTSCVQIFNLKQLLYIEEDDVMRKLNSSNNSDDIKIVLEEEKSHLHKEHIVQALILHWMFYRQHFAANIQYEHNILDNILSLLKDYVATLNIDELSTCYLYLRKMGIENSDPVVQKLLSNSLSKIERTEDTSTLQALSRLLLGISTDNEFFMPMLCTSFMPHLQKHIELCDKEENASLIAICLFHLQKLTNDEMINLYKEKVSNLLAAGKISSATTKTVIKILKLLNIPVWSHQHVPLIRQLLLTLKGSIKQLDANDLKTICRIYEYHMEPVCLKETLAETVENNFRNQLTPESLACVVPFTQSQGRETLINAFKALLNEPKYWQTQHFSGYMFSALRGLKISDAKICNSYWNCILNELDTISEKEIDVSFLRHCHRYMHFNNNLGGTYRHVKLEKKLSQLCMRAIEYDLAGRIPKIFVRLASFVLAYGHTPFSSQKYPNILLSKIITMGQQFNPTDCSLISRGLQISLEMRYRTQIPQLVCSQLATIDSVLTACIEKHLNDEDLTVIDLNMLVRTLSNRKGLRNSIIYHKTLQKYKEIQCHYLNSRVIKDMTYNFLDTNYLVPEMLEKMFDYIEMNREHMGGEAVEKILSCAYNLGYTPQSFEVLHHAGAILLRDFEYMSGLTLVQACLALCHYKTIPEELINKVFCVKFIQRVEEEIQQCYSKATYPERVLQIVMQLNRSVCLDFPEANVPWFQQSFIEAQISKKPPIESSFSRNVKKMLTAILKNESYIRCNHVTPYGYQIDFVINFDKNKNPTEVPVEVTMLDRITKVAILLFKLDSFCENDLSALKGPDSLKIKHLEMMGYKVLHINEHDWNSKYMNLPGAKQNYLKCLLQISN